MKLKYNVLIVGAGKMGAFFDAPNSKEFLTHAHAFKVHKGFNLVGFVDADERQSRLAAKKWKTKSFRSIKEAFASEKIDVICVTTSTDTHYKILKEVSAYPVKLILLEKPIAGTIPETEEIMRLFRKYKKIVVVNYFRRFLPELEKIKNNIDKNIYGNFVSGSGCYGKGILNNGSHMINLLTYFLGEISSHKVFDVCNDYSAIDSTISSILTFKNKKQFIMKGVSAKLFTLFEMDLIFEKQRIRITDSGQKIEFHKIKPNPIFKGYKNMQVDSGVKTSFDKYMYLVADNIYNNLNKGQKIKCDINDAYKTSRICFKILNSK
jgi:predicted dehydrogenase